MAWKRSSGTISSSPREEASRGHSPVARGVPKFRSLILSTEIGKDKPIRLPQTLFVALISLVVSACGGTATHQPGDAGADAIDALGGILVGTEPYIWDGNPATHIFSMNVDGSGKKILTDDNGSKTPEWTCDGKQIVYAYAGQIWMMNADASGKHQITLSPIGATAPSISCDGKLLFASFSSKTKKANLWIMDSLTSTPRQLSNENNFDAAGRISPDGTEVVFTRYLKFDPATQTDTGRELFIINSEGTAEKQLTFITDDPNAPDANAPAWSPDSKQIAFFNGFEETGANRTTPDTRNLAVINVDGTGKHLLTHCDVTSTSIHDSKSPGSCADDPNWSPDGNWIIYSSSGMNTYIIASDGSGSFQKFLSGLFLFGNGGGRPWKF